MKKIQLSSTIDTMESQLEELIVVDGMMEAEIIKSKLDSFQIPNMLKYESSGRLFGITINGLGKVKVMVPVKYLEEAKKILEPESDSQ